VGTVVGAGVASGALDWGYDQLPQSWQNGIESGANAIGSGLEEAGSAIGEGAKNLWNSIF
jgi:hypothetical protein